MKNKAMGNFSDMPQTFHSSRGMDKAPTLGGVKYVSGYRWNSQVGSSTYDELKRKGYLRGRRSMTKSRTRGWVKASPSKGKQRHEMKKRYGSKCFLEPENEKYTICKKNSCEIDERGVQSAYNRARQYKNKKVAEKARRMLNSYSKK